MSKRLAKSAEEFVRSEAPEAKAQAAKIAGLEAEVSRLRGLLGQVERAGAAKLVAPDWLRPRKIKHHSLRATACLQFSDTHFDENVNPSELGGINAYSREIAELRLARWVAKAIEQCERNKHDWDGGLIFADGDFFSGDIHDELRETNCATMPESIDHWAPLVAAAFREVANYVKRLHVVVEAGNHGRLGMHMPFKRRQRNSWDTLLMRIAARLVEKDSRITWSIPDSSWAFVPIYDRHVFMTHGDEAGGGGGWAGIWSPLNTIYKRAVELAAAFDLRISYAVIGHFHQTILAHSRGISLNGSMVGWNEYAAGKRFVPESAKQNWWVETPSHGVTLAGPLFLEDRKAEGW